MDESFEICIYELNSVDPKLAEEYKELVKTTEYDYGTLYRVYMENGNRAANIIKRCSSGGANAHTLLYYSELELKKHAEMLKKCLDALSNQHYEDTHLKWGYQSNKNKKSKEEKLPRKFRNGW